LTARQPARLLSRFVPFPGAGLRAGDISRRRGASVPRVRLRHRGDRTAKECRGNCPNCGGIPAPGCPLPLDQFTGSGNHGGSKTSSAPVDSSNSPHLMLSPRREYGSTHLNVRLSSRIPQKATRAARVSTSRTGSANKIPKASAFVASATLNYRLKTSLLHLAGIDSQDDKQHRVFSYQEGFGRSSH
jgi:hypothetical protein